MTGKIIKYRRSHFSENEFYNQRKTGQISFAYNRWKYRLPIYKYLSEKGIRIRPSHTIFMVHIWSLPRYTGIGVQVYTTMYVSRPLIWFEHILLHDFSDKFWKLRTPSPIYPIKWTKWKGHKISISNLHIKCHPIILYIKV